MTPNPSKEAEMKLKPNTVIEFNRQNFENLILKCIATLAALEEAEKHLKQAFEEMREPEHLSNVTYVKRRVEDALDTIAKLKESK